MRKLHTHTHQLRLTSWRGAAPRGPALELVLGEAVGEGEGSLHVVNDLVSRPNCSPGKLEGEECPSPCQHYQAKVEYPQGRGEGFHPPEWLGAESAHAAGLSHLEEVKVV